LKNITRIGAAFFAEETHEKKDGASEIIKNRWALSNKNQRGLLEFFGKVGPF